MAVSRRRIHQIISLEEMLSEDSSRLCAKWPRVLRQVSSAIGCFESKMVRSDCADERMVGIGHFNAAASQCIL